MNEEDYQAWNPAGNQTPSSRPVTVTNVGVQLSSRDLTYQQQPKLHATGRKTKSRARTRQLDGENSSPIRSRQNHLQLLTSQHQQQQSHCRSATAIDVWQAGNFEQSHQFSNSRIEKAQNNGENIDLLSGQQQQRGLLLSSSTSGCGSSSGNSTGSVMSFSPRQPRLNGQYSASQAQLQSLTNESNDDISCSIMRRKTPESQLFHYRSQLSLSPQATTTSTTSTKPMMTSMLNEQASSSFSLINSAATPLQHQVRPGAPKSQVHPPTVGSGSQSFLQPPTTSSNHLLPPPYSASVAATGVQNQQQHVICHQPPPVQAQQYSSGDNQQPQQTPQAQASGSNSGLGAGVRSSAQNPIQSNNSSSSASSTSNQQAAGNFSSSSLPFGQHLFPPVYLTVAHATAAAASSALTEGSHCTQQQLTLHHNNTTNLQQQQQQQQSATIVGASKSKSCLTCADISIKWYIVVIALLGLICALIGTIVGAVHSVGRDYISLALLLIGVGLVLIAISWVALRITVKTYRSSGGRGGRSQLGNQQQHRHHYQNHHHQLHLSQHQQRALHHHPHAQPPPLLNPPPILRPAQLSRLLNSAGLSGTGGIISGGISRSVANERLYIAAAAAAALSRYAPPEPSHPAGTSNGSASGLMGGIKRRIPRSLACLIPCSSAAGPSQAGPARSTRAGMGGPSIVNFGPDGSSSALAALLHHYQQQAAAGLVPPLLFGPSPPPAHLFAGLAGPDGLPIRPPPPSYSASMQDYRLRQLLQERAKQQQQQQPAQPPQQTATSTPQPQAGHHSVSAASAAVAAVASDAQQQTQVSSQDGLTRIQVTSALESSSSSGRVHMERAAIPVESVSVTNDIYEASAQEHQQHSEASQRAAEQNSDQQRRAGQQEPQQQRPNSQVKILGYL